MPTVAKHCLVAAVISAPTRPRMKAGREDLHDAGDHRGDGDEHEDPVEELFEVHGEDLNPAKPVGFKAASQRC